MFGTNRRVCGWSMKVSLLLCGEKCVWSLFTSLFFSRKGKIEGCKGSGGLKVDLPSGSADWLEARRLCGPVESCTRGPPVECGSVFEERAVLLVYHEWPQGDVTEKTVS